MWTMWSPLSVATLLLAFTAADSAYPPYHYGQRINVADQSAQDYQSPTIKTPLFNQVGKSLKVIIAPTVDPRLRALCKKPRGQFPGTTCRQFVNCWDEVVVEQECPLDYNFNEKLNYCDFPWKAPCTDQPTQQIEPVGAEVDLGVPGAKCPTLFGTYRSTRNCGVFYMCVGYLPYEFTCPAGLNFHKGLQVCDYTNRVECNGVPTNTVPQPTTQPEAEFTTTPSVQISPEGPAPAPVVVDGPPPTYIDGSAPPPPPPVGVDASQPIVVAELNPSGSPL